MNLYRILRLAILLALSSCVFGQSAPSPAGSSPQSQKNGIILSTLVSGDQSGNVDILSDTRGVNFGPYLKQILKKVRENWHHLIPKCAETMKGKLAIEFAITKDGRLADMKLVSTAGEMVLDRAAWGGITLEATSATPNTAQKTYNRAIRRSTLRRYRASPSARSVSFHAPQAPTTMTAVETVTAPITSAIISPAFFSALTIVPTRF